MRRSGSSCQSSRRKLPSRHDERSTVAWSDDTFIGSAAARTAPSSSRRHWQPHRSCAG